MEHPKVISAQAIDNQTLVIEFANHQMKKYDVSPLFRIAMFEPLKNPALFKSVKVETGGYAVVWNEDIDISEYELWQHGQSIS